MTWMLLAFSILVIIIIAIVKFSLQKVDNSAELKYQKLDVLFTSAERSFLGVLKLATDDTVEVFGKVRVADVITPLKGQQRSIWQKSFNKISAKHFDFILCRKDDLTPICAIELNDSSHNSKKRKDRDDFLEGACNSAGFPLVQIKAKATYKVTDIKQAITDFLPTGETHHVKETEVTLEPEAVKGERVCPKCSSSMAVRVARKGRNIGNEFWACSAFPKCRHTEETAY